VVGKNAESKKGIFSRTMPVEFDEKVPGPGQYIKIMGTGEPKGFAFGRKVRNTDIKPIMPDNDGANYYKEKGGKSIKYMPGYTFGNSGSLDKEEGKKK
jgi:hypothetical protein